VRRYLVSPELTHGSIRGWFGDSSRTIQAPCPPERLQSGAGLVELRGLVGFVGLVRLVGLVVLLRLVAPSRPLPTSETEKECYKGVPRVSITRP
jgi:hypothetical protein